MPLIGYTKLFASIVTSTIWREPDHVRIVWITLLALAGKDGVAEASIPGLADMAKVSLEDCELALERLAGPDKYSRTQEHEGRRIVAVDGGWKLINHAKYRAKMSREDRREYLRLKQRDRRQQLSTNVNSCSDVSTLSTHTEADTDTKAEAEPKARKIKPTRAKDAREPEAFTAFYQRYPKHEDRAGALKAWTKLNPNPEVITAINRALDWQTTQPSWTKDGGRFVPMPSTWLNKRRWEDEPFHQSPDVVDPNAASWDRILKKVGHGDR